MDQPPKSVKISRSALLKCIGERVPVTRFAPSPTGYLHLGHLVNAIYVWGIARGLGGKVILRMEDHDRTRVRTEYERAILEDLNWLGFTPDIGLDSSASDVGSNRPGLNDLPRDLNPQMDQDAFSKFKLESPSPYRQSDSNDLYASVAKGLLHQGLLYACNCSRKTLLQRVKPLPNGNIPYDGFCRDRGLPVVEGISWRIRLSEIGAVHFNDLLQGPQVHFPPKQCGDVVVRDRNGNWTYQFTVVIDDVRHEVNLIIRGMDILESTGRQQSIARVIDKVNELGPGIGKPDIERLKWNRLAACCYLHHGLLMAPNGVKLSKKHFDKDIHKRMLEGEPREDVIGEASFLAGLISEMRPVQMKEIPRLVLE